MLRTRKGFTLIELLIVIGIIGVLAGILFVVINPAQQRTKAQQAVLRNNVEKLCLAKSACIAADSTSNGANCATYANMGTNDPTSTPAGATYAPGASTTTVTGTLGTCTYSCSTATGVISITSGANTCLVQ